MSAEILTVPSVMQEGIRPFHINFIRWPAVGVSLWHAATVPPPLRALEITHRYYTDRSNIVPIEQVTAEHEVPNRATALHQLSQYLDTLPPDDLIPQMSWADGISPNRGVCHGMYVAFTNQSRVAYPPEYFPDRLGVALVHDIQKDPRPHLDLISLVRLARAHTHGNVWSALHLLTLTTRALGRGGDTTHMPRVSGIDLETAERVLNKFAIHSQTKDRPGIYHFFTNIASALLIRDAQIEDSSRNIVPRWIKHTGTILAMRHSNMITKLLRQLLFGTDNSQTPYHPGDRKVFDTMLAYRSPWLRDGEGVPPIPRVGIPHPGLLR